MGIIGMLAPALGCAGISFGLPEVHSPIPGAREGELATWSLTNQGWWFFSGVGGSHDGFYHGKASLWWRFYPAGERKSCLEMGEQMVMIWNPQMLGSIRMSWVVSCSATTAKGGSPREDRVGLFLGILLKGHFNRLTLNTLFKIRPTDTPEPLFHAPLYLFHSLYLFCILWLTY